MGVEQVGKRFIIKKALERFIPRRLRKRHSPLTPFCPPGTSRPDFSKKEAWNERYREKWGAGTRTHTVRGNIQFYRAKCDALRRCLKAIGQDLAGKDVLDAAGGSGVFIDFFLKEGVRTITLTDFSEVAVRRVRDDYGNNDHVHAYVADIRVPLEEGPDQYDFIFVMEAMFLLPRQEDLHKAILSLTAKLKIGGYIIISGLFGDQEVIMDYRCYWPRWAYEKFLAEAGVKIVSYAPQTVLFNRRIFGLAQPIVENVGPLYYWLDRGAQALGLGPAKNLDVKYLIGTRYR